MALTTSRWLALAGLLTASLAACANILGFDDLHGGTCGDGGCEATAPTAALEASLPPDGDAAVDTGVDASCPPWAYFCDGFESGDTLQWKERTFDTAKSSIAVTPDAAHTGRYSLRATTIDAGDPGPAAYLRRYDLNVGEGTTFVARAYVDFSGTVGRGTLLRLMYSDGPTEVTLGYDRPTKKLLVGTRNSALDAGETKYALSPLTRSDWLCVEWIVRVGTDGGQKVLVNGETVLDYAVNTIGDPSAVMDELRLGVVANYDPTVAWSVGFDDVVLATAPVGCP